MADYLGDVPIGVTLEHDFDLFASGVPTNLAGSPVISAYKNQSTTQITTGITLTVGFDGLTGLHHLTVNLAADGTFYAADSYIRYIVTAGTLDGASQIGRVVAYHTIEQANGILALLKQAATSIISGAAVTGTLSSTQMTTNLTEVTDNHFNRKVIVWTSGVLRYQATDVTAYLGSTKRLTYTATPTGEAPSNGDTFVMF